MTLDEFMDSEYHNAWIKHGQLDCYVRKDRHVIQGVVRSVLTLSNFNNARKRNRDKNISRKEKPTSTGSLRKLDHDLYEHAKKAGLYGVRVENVLNEWLPDKLLEYGYYYIDKREFMPCFIKPC